MAENSAPELYLSLLSGRYADVSHISTEQRLNDFGPRFCRPFTDELMGVLDAIAAICVRKKKGQTFFVSLSMGSDFATLYISSNETVPATIVDYLHKIRDQLRQFHDVMQFPSITTENQSSPNPNDTQPRKDHELELQKTIYEHTYCKLRQRFLKRGPGILKVYSSVLKNLKTKGITTKDAAILDLIRTVLQGMGRLLQQHEKPPGPDDLARLICGIDALCGDEHLKVAGDENVLSLWENSIYTIFDADQTRLLSLRRLLEKLCTLHHHISAITRVAWSHRLKPLLLGNFNIVCVPAYCGNISTKFSQHDVFPIIFPPGNQAKQDVRKRVYDKLLEGLKAKVNNEGLGFQKGTVLKLSLDVNVHAECTLLAYHLQHPDTNPYSYFGGSKLSCHGCATFFTAFNLVAKSFSHPRFFTKGCHNKIYLRWPCPSLLSQEQQIRLRGKETLDTQVRKGMVDILSDELAKYVEELCAVAEAPSRSLSDSTNSSGNSHAGVTLAEAARILSNRHPSKR